MNSQRTDGKDVKVIHSLIGVIALSILATLLVAVACQREPSPTTSADSVPTPYEGHFHPPGTPEHPHPTPTGAQSAHEHDEGLTLGPGSGEESVREGPRCSTGAPVREYGVVAINVEITLNRYLDYDPEGRMYVLAEELERVRGEEALNREARATGSESAVSLGLQGDAIQPLIIRVNQGECLRVTLTNHLSDGERASLHIHGSGQYVAATGAPAIATNAESYVSPGESVAYEWTVGDSAPEGTHYFHSHASERLQTSHGLFGAVIVEPEGSQHTDPLTGKELRSGWAAIIADPNGSDFREFAIAYHEIGDDSFSPLNKDGEALLQVDPFSGAYRPGGRAINYRSEPFMNRLKLQSETVGIADMSQAYSSYVFGDPATPIARNYLGDPVKQRLIHGGSEVFHVHHVHGGAIRWRRQPDAEPTGFDIGFEKRPPLLPQVSERVDSQSVGPSETYDLENECGAGGCQQSTGDFLIHCHVANHYLAGMWMIWRTYNTLQDGAASQDALPALIELPDRSGRVKPSVTSEQLVGKSVDWKGKSFSIDQDNLAQWVEQQLPPKGAPKGYDASVLDWQRSGVLYLNEPESAQSWPGFESAHPGDRLPLRFDSITGKLSYPFLRPHLGKRPPFAPNHGPAPFLEPMQQGTGPPRPGENGPWSLCPSGAEPQNYVVHAITLPIAHNEKYNIVDNEGQIFVLKEQEEKVRADNGLRVPLAIRANAGEDCVDILLKSELDDATDRLRFSKVNIHIHFVQFDVQASDGVNTGFNYEQSVRPFAAEGETLVFTAFAGDFNVAVSDPARFHPGILIGVGMDQEDTFEVRRIEEIRGSNLVLDEPLQYDHAAGEIVSTEFVRYRWFPDVQFGTAYFHDHVNALSSWRHGLFGAFIAEPPGSTYHDPYTGAELRSGPVADIHTNSRVSADVTGSFREMVMFIQDEHPTLRVADTSGSAFNLRAEPLALRGGPPERLFSSELHGDPATPVLAAFLGDPIVVRSLVSATNDVHTWHVDGHWFRIEPHSLSSPPTSTVHLAISERYDLIVPAAGGPQKKPGDYLFYNGRHSRMLEGSWGIIRVLDDPRGTPLKPLPGRAIPSPASGSVCPDDSSRKQFEVVALEVALPMLEGGNGKIFVLKSQKREALSGIKPPEPLVLHVNVGDCIIVRLTNETSEGQVSFHADMLAFDPKESYGVEAGYDGPQSVAPGQTRTYTFYAHPQVGETAALIRDWGDALTNPRLGLYGAIVVGPAGARYSHPVTGEDISLASSWTADVHPPSGPSYRDFTLFLQDEDGTIGTAKMPYRRDIEGVVALNYTKQPLAQSGDSAGVRGSPYTVENSATPIMEAYVGDAVRVNVLVPFSEQNHVFTIEGHEWPMERGLPGSDMLSSVQIGGSEAIAIWLQGGAGGTGGMPGDYLYGDHRQPYREAGLWGLLRVHEPTSKAQMGPLPSQ